MIIDYCCREMAICFLRTKWFYFPLVPRKRVRYLWFTESGPEMQYSTVCENIHWLSWTTEHLWTCWANSLTLQYWLYDWKSSGSTPAYVFSLTQASHLAFHSAFNPYDLTGAVLFLILYSRGKLSISILKYIGTTSRLETNSDLT